MQRQRKAYRWHPDVAAAVESYAKSRRISETEAIEQFLIAIFDLEHLQADPKSVQKAKALLKGTGFKVIRDDVENSKELGTN